MSGFRVTTFGGEAPRVPARKLPPNLAQTAQNCDLRNGDLLALKDGLFVATPSKAWSGTVKSIYLWGESFWFNWLSDVDVIRGPIAGDTTERTYFTGLDYPRVTDSSIATGGSDYPNASYRIGVPQPGTTPTITVDSGGTCNEADKKSVAMVYTYVNSYGEEGPPSAASAVADLCEGDSITIGNLAAPSGNYNIITKRIYAAVSGEYQYLTEVAAANSSASITWSLESLAEVIESTDWWQPPDDMKGLCMLPNGIAAGFSGNEVMFSEAWLPHAWPTDYRHALDFPVVGVITAGSALVAGTTGKPYLFTGVDPASMSGDRLKKNQACVSKRSMVDMGDSAMYASPDGLTVVTADGQVVVATEPYMRREDWQALKPESIHGYYWEGQYLGFYDNGSTQGGFLFDPSGEGLRFIDIYATAGHNVLEEDALYLVVDGEIVQWNAGAALSYTWKSKEFVSDKPINMGAIQVKAASYPVTCMVYADGILKHTQTVTSSKPFRPPSGYLADTWSAKVMGSAQVHEIVMAETLRELKTV